MISTLTQRIKQATIATVCMFSFSQVNAQNGKVLATMNADNVNKIAASVAKQNENSSSRIDEMVHGLSITKIVQAFPASRQQSLLNVYEISCNCDVNDLYKATAEASDLFTGVEMISEFETLEVPNDLVAQGYDYAMNLINAQGAWDLTHGDSSIVIAITDQNYYYNHEDLVGKFNYVSANMTTTYTHGTAVAVTAAGKTNNATGKSAIGYNSTMQLRAMDFNQVLEATYSGARIINMSWASGCYPVLYHQEVLNEAHDNGMILVAAAGNGGTCGYNANLVYPSAYDHVISVSSVGPADNHQRYIGDPNSTHQHNATVDICAPGYDVLITWAPGAYGTGNGTSFAAPIVSGTIALMLAVNPCLSAEKIEYLLKTTAVNIDAQNPMYVGLLGAGRLDAGAAVYAAAHFGTDTLNGSTTFECTTMEQGITLDLSTVQQPATIVWNTGDTSVSINNLEPGIYTGIVTDVNGCLGVFTTSIDTLFPMSISADLTHPSCYNDANGAIDIHISGGHGNYTFNWSNGYQVQDMEYLIAGNYSVTATDSKGCTVFESFEIIQPAAINVTKSVVQPHFYTKGSIDVEVSGGTMPYNFSWNTGQQQEYVTGLDAGFYEVLVTDSKGCMGSVNAVLVNHLMTEVSSIDHLGKVSGGEATVGTTANLSNLEVSVDELNVFPIPARELCNVVWNDIEVGSIAVFNLSGQLIESYENLEHSSQLTIENIPSGEYFLHIQSTKRGKVIKKIIIS